MISALRSFFDLNHEIVLFIYGQVFFVLGLAVALQSRRHTRLELGASLRWLALFGITHGLHEWGLLLIPIQANYLSAPATNALHVIRIFLLAASFAALFQFGADLLRTKYGWAVWLPLLSLGVWLLTVLVLGAVQDRSIGFWQQDASILARYFIGFPAAILAAFGLRYQAEKQIRPLGLHRIYDMLRVAGIALLAYAVVGGLIVPYGDFFPARVVNQSLLVATVGIPAPVFRSLAGTALAVAIIRALEVFDYEIDSLIEGMEIERNLAAERERIGRELHDGAIQRVYTAGLIIESASRKVGDEQLVRQRLDRAMAVLNEAIASLRAYMTDLRDDPTTASLREGLVKQIRDAHLDALLHVEMNVDLPDQGYEDSVKTAHVLAIVGEALANVTRHAQAHSVKVTARVDGRDLTVCVEDDGTGFVTDGAGDGYGLRNMRDRARLIGGTIILESVPGSGTRLMLQAPWEEPWKR